jgi:hypothetical protein
MSNTLPVGWAPGAALASPAPSLLQYSGSQELALGAVSPEDMPLAEQYAKLLDRKLAGDDQLARMQIRFVSLEQNLEEAHENIKLERSERRREGAESKRKVEEEQRTRKLLQQRLVREQKLSRKLEIAALEKSQMDSEVSIAVATEARVTKLESEKAALFNEVRSAVLAKDQADDVRDRAKALVQQLVMENTDLKVRARTHSHVCCGPNANSILTAQATHFTLNEELALKSLHKSLDVRTRMHALARTTLTSPLFSSGETA